MTITTRFPNGVTNVGEDSMFADMGQLLPTKYHSYMEDFDYYVQSNWTETIPSGGAVALDSGDNGVLHISNNAGSLNTEILKAAENFGGAITSTFWFETRFKLLTALEGVVRVGLKDSANYARLYFQKANGSAVFSFVVGDFSGAQTTSVPLAVAEDGTWIRLGFVVEPGPLLKLFVNGQYAGTANVSDFPGSGYSYAPYAKLQTSAASNDLYIDYFFGAKER